MSQDLQGAERPAYWEPGPTLTVNVTTTLRALARRWPRAMAAALDPSEAGRAYMHDFAYALRDADAAVWPELAREYMAAHEFPPGPFELRLVARRLADRYAPKAQPEPCPPPPIQTGHDLTRMAEVNAVLKAELGGALGAMEAWEYLGQAAIDDPKRFAEVRAGKVTPEQLAAAIVAVRAQRARKAPQPDVSEDAA